MPQVSHGQWWRCCFFPSPGCVEAEAESPTAVLCLERKKQSSGLLLDKLRKRCSCRQLLRPPSYQRPTSPGAVKTGLDGSSSSCASSTCAAVLDGAAHSESKQQGKQNGQDGKEESARSRLAGEPGQNLTTNPLRLLTEARQGAAGEDKVRAQLQQFSAFPLSRQQGLYLQPGESLGARGEVPRSPFYLVVNSRPELECVLTGRRENTTRGSSTCGQEELNVSPRSLPSRCGNSERASPATARRALSRQQSGQAPRTSPSSPRPLVPVNLTTLACIEDALGPSLQRLGRGAFGVVAKGTWHGSGEVACKFLVSDEVDNNSAYLEAIVSKVLSHPHVLQTFDFQVVLLDESVLADNTSRMPQHEGSGLSVALHATLGGSTSRICTPTSQRALPSDTHTPGATQEDRRQQGTLPMSMSMWSFEGGNSTGGVLQRRVAPCTPCRRVPHPQQLQGAHTRDGASAAGGLDVCHATPLSGDAADAAGSGCTADALTAGSSAAAEAPRCGTGLRPLAFTHDGHQQHHQHHQLLAPATLQHQGHLLTATGMGTAPTSAACASYVAIATPKSRCRHINMGRTNMHASASATSCDMMATTTTTMDTAGGLTPMVSSPHPFAYDMQLMAASTYSTDSFDLDACEQQQQASSQQCSVRELLRGLGGMPGKYATVIIMEYADDGTLQDAIMRRRLFRPSPSRSAFWAMRALLRTAREVAQGMAHLHTMNIIHGDLKPGNVLLKSKSTKKDSRGFVAKVADFGLSRISTDKSCVSTQEWSTVAFMAPEYIDNRLMQASDVYSFGVMLWQMFTCQTPFVDHHQAQVAAGVMMGNLSLEWPQGAPPALVELATQCCAFEAHQRPTFRQVAERLTTMELAVRENYQRSKVVARSHSVNVHSPTLTKTAGYTPSRRRGPTSCDTSAPGLAAPQAPSHWPWPPQQRSATPAQRLSDLGVMSSFTQAGMHPSMLGVAVNPTAADSSNNHSASRGAHPQVVQASQRLLPAAAFTDWPVGATVGPMHGSLHPQHGGRVVMDSSKYAMVQHRRMPARMASASHLQAAASAASTAAGARSSTPVPYTTRVGGAAAAERAAACSSAPFSHRMVGQASSMYDYPSAPAMPTQHLKGAVCSVVSGQAANAALCCGSLGAVRHCSSPPPPPGSEVPSTRTSAPAVYWATKSPTGAAPFATEATAAAAAVPGASSLASFLHGTNQLTAAVAVGAPYMMLAEHHMPAAASLACRAPSGVSSTSAGGALGSSGASSGASTPAWQGSSATRAAEQRAVQFRQHVSDYGLRDRLGRVQQEQVATQPGTACAGAATGNPNASSSAEDVELASGTLAMPNAPAFTALPPRLATVAARGGGSSGGSGRVGVGSAQPHPPLRAPSKLSRMTTSNPGNNLCAVARVVPAPLHGPVPVVDESSASACVTVPAPTGAHGIDGGSSASDSGDDQQRQLQRGLSLPAGLPCDSLPLAANSVACAAAGLGLSADSLQACRVTAPACPGFGPAESFQFFHNAKLECYSEAINACYDPGTTKTAEAADLEQQDKRTGTATVSPASSTTAVVTATAVAPPAAAAIDFSPHHHRLTAAAIRSGATPCKRVLGAVPLLAVLQEASTSVGTVDPEAVATASSLGSRSLLDDAGCDPSDMLLVTASLMGMGSGGMPLTQAALTPSNPCPSQHSYLTLSFSRCEALPSDRERDHDDHAC